MDVDALRTIRHDTRGTANSLKMCVTVLDVPMSDDERVGFVEEVIRAADRIAELMAALESLPDDLATD
jgi:hypothetical protein